MLWSAFAVFLVLLALRSLVTACLLSIMVLPSGVKWEIVKFSFLRSTLMLWLHLLSWSRSMVLEVWWLHVVAVFRIRCSNWMSGWWFLVPLEMVSLKWRMSAAVAGVHPLRLLALLCLCLQYDLVGGAG